MSSASQSSEYTTLRQLLPPAWRGMFSESYPRSKFEELADRIDALIGAEPVCPAPGCIFRALEKIAPAEVKAVIVGQDPYPTAGDACGLAFSVAASRRIPGSLRNIYAELQRSVNGWTKPTHGNLEDWSGRGVLLLNSVLTTREGAAASHYGKGWEEFTAAVLRYVSEQSPFAVFLLWGKKAVATVKPHIDLQKHVALESSHPSPLSENRVPKGQGFVGNNHFIRANIELKNRGREPIDWSLRASAPGESPSPSQSSLQFD